MFGHTIHPSCEKAKKRKGKEKGLNKNFICIQIFCSKDEQKK
jgi:hypothetical protein